MDGKDTLEQQLSAELVNSPLAKRVLKAVVASEEYHAINYMANSVAVNRMKITDHGFTHAMITALNAMRIFNVLQKAGVKTNWEMERHGNSEEARVIVLLGALCHDFGNAIHRDGHHGQSLVVARPFVSGIVSKFFKGVKRIEVELSVLQCIYCHDESVQAYSIEESIVKIADGVDCAHGRARVPHELLGNVNEYTLSSNAIDDATVVFGTMKKPVKIVLKMNDKIGRFQIDQVLQKKIDMSTIKDMVEIEVQMK
ncbi:Uncharacterised protein [Candidatus Gugararchaeum adminiculabundum]|nr:Uncharacterised protein [Candidatus Gugararchaeum adminiculabundum]